MMRAVFISAAGAFVLLFSDASSADAPVITKLIQDARPCSGLKGEAKLGPLPVSIGIDKFKDLHVHDFKVRIDGDAFFANVDVTLACRTSDKAVVKGDASAHDRGRPPVVRDKADIAMGTGFFFLFSVTAIAVAA